MAANVRIWRQSLGVQPIDGNIEPSEHWKSRGLDLLGVAPTLASSLLGKDALPSVNGRAANSKWAAVGDRTFSNETRNLLPLTLPITLFGFFRVMGTVGTGTYPSVVDFYSVFANSARGGYAIGVGGDLGGGSADVRRVYSIVRNVGYASNERLIKVSTAITAGVWYFAAQRLTAAAHELIVAGHGSVSGTTATPGTNAVDGIVVASTSSTAWCETAVFGRFASALTDREIRELADDPLQLLEPARILVPVSAASTVPTLSLPTVTAITTTGARLGLTLS